MVEMFKSGRVFHKSFRAGVTPIFVRSTLPGLSYQLPLVRTGCHSVRSLYCSSNWRTPSYHFINRRHYSTRLGTRGPFSWPSLGFLLLAIGAAFMYERKLRREKAQREHIEYTGAGKPDIGGEFHLVDHHGNQRTEKDFFGCWLLVYFGYTFCPDICPEELEKMGNVLNKLETMKLDSYLDSVFITVDPERDTPQTFQKYLKDFHPRILGLTGTQEQIDSVTKSYRIYHSQSAKDSDNDYLVDHTMYTYLMGPDGGLVEYYGRDRQADDIAGSIATHIKTNQNK